MTDDDPLRDRPACLALAAEPKRILDDLILEYRDGLLSDDPARAQTDAIGNACNRMLRLMPRDAMITSASVNKKLACAMQSLLHGALQDIIVLSGYAEVHYDPPGQGPTSEDTDAAG